VSGHVIEAIASAGTYEVRVGPGLLDGLGEIVRSVTAAPTAALVSDETVMGVYGEQVERALTNAGLRVERFGVRAGEASKSWGSAGALLEAFSERGLCRDDVVIALGGGVVGDLAGFCAATYMRGIGLVQAPTTLLAQVDSSIGGKTGVDLPRGKNLAGAFWPPLVVVADTACLATLPGDEWRSGLAEVAKSAILDDETSLSLLEDDSAALLERGAGPVERAVVMAAGLKVRIVSGDERESGMREALNLGHTLGHAIEQVAGYGEVPHGVAVAEGMRFAARLAERVLGADPAWSERQHRLLERLGLGRTGCPYASEGLLAAMRADKKVRAGEVRFVLSTGPGDWDVRSVGNEVLTAELEAWCGD
jgi:3-dehydroquinate synthase